MPAPLNPNLWPTVLHDQDGIPFGTSTNPIFVTGGGGGGGSPNQPTFAVGQKNVTTPLTAVQLQASAVPNGFSIFLRAKAGNTGNIWVGPTALVAQDHTAATPLEAGAFLELFLTDTSDIWIDADVGGEGATWTVEHA